MATVALIEYENASPEVRAVFDDIKRTRNVPDVNNFWKALANHPETLKRTWETLREVMRPGALDPLTKEMIYVAVSVANNCDYCIHSHTAAARAKGMTDAQHQELLAVIGMASQTNALSTALKVPVDPQFLIGSRRIEGGTMPFIERNAKGLTRCLADASLDPEKLRIHISEAAPGGRLHEAHTHAGVEAFYVLEGQATVEWADERHTIGPGEAIILDASTPHGIYNTGDVPVRYMVIIAKA